MNLVKLDGLPEKHLVEVAQANYATVQRLYPVREAREMLRNEGDCGDFGGYRLVDTQPARHKCSCHVCRRWRKSQKRDRRAERRFDMPG